MSITWARLVAIIYLNLTLYDADVQIKNGTRDDIRSAQARRNVHDVEDNKQDIHRKIALIDIVFTNGKKRTCTGAIIHCHVVITAGHCFFGPKSIPQEFAEPELTTSFVVIGTKQKFDSGYEQYLPIERILTHPNIKPWSCDLALVHTFASMTADNIGAVIALASERAYTSIEPNVTILSWGRALLPDEVSLEDNLEKEDNSPELPENEPEHIENIPTEPTEWPDNINDEKTIIYEGNMEETTSMIIIRVQDKSKVNKYQSKHIPRTEDNVDQANNASSRHSESNETKNEHTVIQNEEPKEELPDVNVSRTFKRAGNTIKRHRKTYKSQYWRRQMGPKEGNKLSVETFELINALACKKTTEKIMARYDLTINVNEIACYDSVEQYVTDEDSGAPVVRYGQLIAITVGGIDIDGDHVAIGMKLSYFCPWIADNLPPGDTTIHCVSTHPKEDREHKKGHGSNLGHGPEDEGDTFEPYKTYRSGNLHDPKYIK